MNTALILIATHIICFVAGALVFRNNPKTIAEVEAWASAKKAKIMAAKDALK